MSGFTFSSMIPQLSVLSYSDLSSRGKQEIVELCTEAYQEDFTEVLALFPQPTHVLAHVEGTLVSHACWVTRWLQPEGEPLLRTAYIEAVATVPGYQGRGIGSIVMQKVAEEIQEYELGGLSPASDHIGFYERLGWEMWKGPKAIRTAHGLLIDTHLDRLMVLRTGRTPALRIDRGITAEWREGDLW